MEQLQAENAALREAINKMAEGEWMIASWYDRERVGNEFHWRVNVRDEPSKSQRSQTYSGTTHAGRTPVDAALSALAALPRGGGAGEQKTETA